jgi:regulator of nucleoside diphosphate kinase
MPVRESNLLLTEPDAERLSLLSRYVNSPLDGRHLLELERKLAEAEVCEPEEIPPDVVTMNSRVRVHFLDTGEHEVYTLVFPSRANAQQRRISVLGSLGRALLGARVGDEVEFASGVGTRRCRIEQLIYQPESAGDYLA